MKLVRKILFPVVPVYYMVTWVRNRFFDWGVLDAKSYDLPVICVGNLSVGGTGKTPMIEYLIRLLQDNYRVATLSRGYKRSTEGFVMADATATAKTIGDEPYQFYAKFSDAITVAVDSNRQRGIAALIETQHPEVILLDDAFQHRKVKAGFNILLTTYNNLYSKDMLLPTGDLRESRAGADRAQLIVVTKCPETLSENEKATIVKQLGPKPNQEVFFSHIAYDDSLYSKSGNKPLEALIDERFTLVTGIANADPLVAYLKEKGCDFEHLNFPDHHEFKPEECATIDAKPLVITTEKDYMRLKGQIQTELYYLPIRSVIDRAAVFNAKIQSFVEEF